MAYNRAPGREWLGRKARAKSWRSLNALDAVGEWFSPSLLDAPRRQAEGLKVGIPGGGGGGVIVSDSWWQLTLGGGVQTLSLVPLCNPTNCSMPGFPVLQSLLCQSFLKLVSIESVISSNHLILSPERSQQTVDQNKLWKILQEMETPDHWPASWEVCMQVKKQQLELDMEQQTGYKLRKEIVKAVYHHPA